MESTECKQEEVCPVTMYGLNNWVRNKSLKTKELIALC